MQLAIIGCPRSGTRYITRVLRQLGVDVGHEKLRAAGTADWHLACNDLAAFDLVLHQVRNPLRFVESLTTIRRTTRHWLHLKKHLPRGCRLTGDWIADGAAVWYWWNGMAEKKARFTYRVDDLSVLLGTVLPLVLGRELTSDEVAKVRAVSPTVNSRRHPGRHCQWASLPAQVRDMACRYGYDVYETPNAGVGHA
jgi:hypothetical protein